MVRQRLRTAAVVVALALALWGCGATSAAVPAPASFVAGGDRPVEVDVPAGIDDRHPAPLLLMLHGFGSTAQEVEEWTYLGAAALERGMAVAAPEGTTDPAGDQFWNAGTPGCCNLYGSDVDDSAYLSGLIAEISSTVAVDPARVYVFGHSNGGFMAYRMACDHADQVAAIVSIAGITVPEDGCSPSGPVHTLQIHGTDDDAILYAGEGEDASAEQMAAIWAAHDGCDPIAEAGSAPLDLDVLLEGAETRVLSYTRGCDAGGSATLWTIEGGGHQPTPTAGFRGLILDFLKAHPKGPAR